MRKTGEKILVSILIVLLIFNFIYSNYVPVCAANAGETAFKGLIDTLTNVMGGVIGVYTWIPRLIMMAIGFAVNVLTAQVAYMDGTTDAGSDFARVTLTPYEIFFNEIQILDVNFLDFDVGALTTTMKIRTAVAQWYYIMRLIAVAILLLILIFVGIKMAITTVASEKAIYKKSLVDWATSLALVFVLQYIIMFTVNANSAIVEALKAIKDSPDVDSGILSIALTGLGFGWQSIAASIVYVIFVIQVLMFLVKYFKRMLTVAFLIIISPLISITYSIDRMGDGKAQALNTWLKEFVFNILIQPFHCIIYLSFLDVVFELLVVDSGADLATMFFGPSFSAAILSIIIMMMIDNFTDLVSKIFGVNQASSLSTLSTMAVAGMFAQGGKMAVGAASNIRKGINWSRQNGLLSAVNKDKSKIASKLGNFSKKFDNPDTKLGKIGTAYKSAKSSIKTKTNKSPIKKLKQAREEKIDKQMREDLGENYEKVIGNKDSAEYKEARAKAVGKVNPKREKIKGFVNSAKNSEVVKYYRDNRNQMISTGVGAFLGVAAAGSGNVLAGIGAGIAAKQGVSEFLSTSSKTIAKDASDYNTRKFETKEEAREFHEMNTQLGDNGEFTSSSDTFKKLQKEIKAMLKEFNEGKSEDEQIDSQNFMARIDYDVFNTPNKPFNLEETLAKVTGKRLDQIPDGNLKETLKSVSANYAQFQFDKNFYETSKKGSQVGMLSEDFAKNLYKNQGNNDAGKLEFKEDSVDTGKVKVDLPKELLATEIKTTGEDGKKEKVTVESYCKTINKNFTEIKHEIDKGDIEATKSSIEDSLTKVKTAMEQLQEVHNKIKDGMPDEAKKLEIQIKQFEQKRAQFEDAIKTKKVNN